MAPSLTEYLAGEDNVVSQQLECCLNNYDDGNERGRSLVQTTLKKRISTINPTTSEPEQEEAFFVADMGEVFRQHIRWKTSLPRVKAHFAVKVNPDPQVIRLLAALGTGFDCASTAEIEQVLNLGVDSQRIIFAHTCKSRSSIRYAAKAGLRQMTFDNADELLKIHELFPAAELYLRIVTDDSSSSCPLSTKFGAALSETGKLLQYARDLDLNVVGVSFHVGSGSLDSTAFVKAVADARVVFDEASSFGYELHTLDVGGGFLSTGFEETAAVLRDALDNHFPNHIRIIAEPGRYFVSDAYTLACSVIARRTIISPTKETSYMLYLNDGVYGNLLGAWLEGLQTVPEVLSSKHGASECGQQEYTIWGPTCDAMDRIVPGTVLFPELMNVGDWLYFRNRGAYSTCLTTRFNGFKLEHDMIYVSSESAASSILGY